ncbi:MAG: acyclic terpene utilization AtuA family protein [Micromonosporaceae bacterium]
MKIMSPTGHLGFTPIERGSFEAGVAERPDAIVADSGSADIGPYPLGANLAHSPEEWQRHDLELCLLAARELDVPLVIGSASDTGTDRGVERYVEIIEELAVRHGLAPFQLAAIYSEMPPARLVELAEGGAVIEGLNGRGPADVATLRRTDHAVAVMGVEPIKAAIEGGADVVICGRSSDSAIFAAVAESRGIPRGPALLAGKLLECASFCAEPFMGKETVIGEIDADGVNVYPKHPQQRCTPASVASHAMYERVDPYVEVVPGGVLDMRELRFEALDERTTRVTGAVWRPSDTYSVKLEGAGKIGERAIAVMGIRDPYTLSRLDDVLAWSRAKLVERYGSPQERGYQVYFHVYGRNGVMGDLEPHPVVAGHEVGIVVEAVAETTAAAEEVCTLASRNLFYARLPEVKGTAGGASFFSDEVLAARPAYEWTLNHVITLDPPGQDPVRAMGLFRTETLRVGRKAVVTK